MPASFEHREQLVGALVAGDVEVPRRLCARGRDAAA